MEQKLISAEVQSLINNAKSKGHSVYALNIGGVKYIYRSINRSEFRELQQHLSTEAEELKRIADEKKAKLPKDDPKLAEVELFVEKEAAMIRERGEERLVGKALLHPSLNDHTPAGVAPTLADRIMEGSGFGNEAEPEIL